MLTVHSDPVVEPSLLARISDARRQSDALFGIIHPDAIFDRPIPERHRIIFYVGHLEAFDWNLLHENVFGLKSFHPEFDRLFAFGIDPVAGGLPSDQPSDWPSMDVVTDYVRKIRASLDEKLLDGSLEPAAHARDGFPLATLLNVAIEHRLMHVETLAYMFHQLPFDRKIFPAKSLVPSESSVAHGMVKIPGGSTTLGLRQEAGVFGWDNEFQAHTADVPAFEIDRYMVTNRQFLEFMNAGGYDARDLWSEGAWNWKSSHRVRHPVFWGQSGDRWLYRTMFGNVALPLEWPVYVSHAEASAYARWVGRELPTEQQWHRAAFGTPDGTQRYYPWGNDLADRRRGNFDLAHWDPVPVNSYPQGQSAFGVDGMLGNGWEWTSSVFAPFPGFEAFPFYRGYSADFFDDKHFVMKGGSSRTAACMLRPTFRNWFQAHYQYVYAGFRCVKSR